MLVKKQNICTMYILNKNLMYVRTLLYLNSRDLIATDTEMGEIVHVLKVLSPENTNDVAADVKGL